MKVVIIGGGAIGTLAGWLMPHATVLDWRRPPTDVKSHRPRRYGAMYLHEPLEGLMCREVTVRTTVDGAPATEKSVRAYKIKVGKELDLNTDWRPQFVEYTVGYELLEFPSADITWGQIVEAINSDHRLLHIRNAAPIAWDRIVSTIPLYSLLEMLGIPCPTPLTHRPIAVRTTPVPMDVQRDRLVDIHVNYISSPDIPIYRTTDRHDSRDNEWLYNPHLFAGVPSKVLRPGKIYPQPWTEAMCQQLNELGIYPIGRAGRWRSNELMHHSYKDLMRIAADARA